MTFPLPHWKSRSDDGTVLEYGCGARAGDEDVLTQVDRRDEGQEYDAAQTGVRSVTNAEVRFQCVAGRWLIDSIDFR